MTTGFNSGTPGMRPGPFNPTPTRNPAANAFAGPPSQSAPTPTRGPFAPAAGFAARPQATPQTGPFGTASSRTTPFATGTGPAAQTGGFAGTAPNAFAPVVSPFGGTSTAQTTTAPFGQTAATSAFGQPRTTSAFGQTATNAFGGTTGAFQTSGAFGNTGAFGQQSTAFRGSSAPFGATTGFGGATTGGFGAQTNNAFSAGGYTGGVPQQSHAAIQAQVQLYNTAKSEWRNNLVKNLPGEQKTNTLKTKELIEKSKIELNQNKNDLASLETETKQLKGLTGDLKQTLNCFENSVLRYTKAFDDIKAFEIILVEEARRLHRSLQMGAISANESPGIFVADVIQRIVRLQDNMIKITEHLVNGIESKQYVDNDFELREVYTLFTNFQDKIWVITAKSQKLHDRIKDWYSRRSDITSIPDDMSQYGAQRKKVKQENNILPPSVLGEPNRSSKKSK